MKLSSVLSTLALVLIHGLTPSFAERVPPVDWLSECEIRGVDDPAWCGSYTVFENREAARGRRIEIYVEVVPALSENPEPDAIFYMMGGPGGPATIATAGIVVGLPLGHRSRDMVFVDQRGTGRSHPLGCGGSGSAGSLQDHFEEFLAPDYVRRCLADQDDADVRLYTTPIAMDDLDEIRAALGYDKINIMGGSYGSRAALIYMRRHPDHVRTALLFGVAPTDMENPLPFAQAAERGRRATFDACAVDPACHRAFPDLSAKWERIVKQFEAGPVTAEVEHPDSKRRETVTISRGVFADGVRHLLYTVRGAAELPRIVDAAGRGDYRPFAEHKLRQSIGFGNLLSMGMFLTVTCSEDVQFIDEADIPPSARGTFLGDYRVRRQLEACKIWPTGKIDPSYQEPVTVDTPTLLMTGVHDTATPYEGGDRVASGLPNGRHIVVPNQSHGRANPNCQDRIFDEFIREGSVDDLETGCLAETKRPPFNLTR